MALSSEDHAAITDLLSLHGHLFDDGELDRLEEVYTPDVHYDVTHVDQGPFGSVAEIREAALAFGGHFVGHHVTNVLLTEVADGEVRARSKGIGIGADGTARSLTYDDVVIRTEQGWRISRRVIGARRTPLGRPG